VVNLNAAIVVCSIVLGQVNEPPVPVDRGSAELGATEKNRWRELEYKPERVGERQVDTTADPGWWKRTFVGWDKNGNGEIKGDERGILIMAWDGIRSVGEGMREAIWSTLIEGVPQDYQVQLEGLGEYFAIGNAWVPFDYLLGLVGVYYAFVTSVIIARLLFSLIGLFL